MSLHLTSNDNTYQQVADYLRRRPEQVAFLHGTTVAGATGELDVTITMSTLAGCPEGSLEDAFTQALDAATTYVLDGFSLVIVGPTGEMHFTPTLPAMA